MDERGRGHPGGRLPARRGSYYGSPTVAQASGERVVGAETGAGGATAPPATAPGRRRLPGQGWRSQVDGVVAAAVVVGTALRLWGLGAQSLWYDEWLTAVAAHGSAPDLLRYVTNQAGIPPSYFAFMWGWARVFGHGEAALRSVSVLAGVATIPVAYAAARELGRRRAVARAAAVLVAVNPMLVWYSQEARPYSLVALLGALSLWALARLLNQGRPRDLGLWALVAAVTVAVHYFAVFLVVVEAAVVVAVRRPQWRDRSDRRALAAACWPAAVVLALLAPFAVRQFSRRGNHSWITGFPLADRLGDAGRSALVGPSYPDGRLWMVAAAVAALAVALLVVRGERDERRGAAVTGGLSLASVAVALAAAAVGVDVIVARYLVVSLVPLVVTVAVGLGAARAPRGIGAAALAVLCGISLVTVVAVGRDPHLQRADWGAVAAAHDAAGGGAGARLLVLSTHDTLAGPLRWYLEGGRPLEPGEAVVVDQVDVVYARPATEPCNPFVGLACSLLWLGAPPPEPLPDGLALDERVELDQFFVDRYRADEPVTVTTADVVQETWLPRSLVLVTVG